MSGPIAAPSTTRVAVESLFGWLSGNLSLATLSQQNEVERAVQVIVEHLRSEMDLHVLATHPAAEQSVTAILRFRSRSLGARPGEGHRGGNERADRGNDWCAAG